MSTIRANSITDSAGTGAPDFPNGITAATIPAENLTGTLPAINGSALTNLPAPTTAQVGTAIAGITAGDVGSHLFGTSTTSGTLAYGASIAGSTLQAGNLNTSGANVDPATRSGTWRFLGYQSGVIRYAIYVRIA